MIKVLLLKKTFDVGQVVFKEGEPGVEAYLVRSGYITVWKHDGSNKIELATRGPGEIIGEMALIDDKTRSATVTAKTKVEVEVITRNDLKTMMLSTPEPLALILHQLMSRLRDTNELAASYAVDAGKS
jgi:CRP-like cAMP-binding protein